MTAAKTERAIKRVAKLLRYGCTEEKAYSVAAMTTGLTIAEVRSAWIAR